MLADELFDARCVEPSPCCSICNLLGAVSVTVIERRNIMGDILVDFITWAEPGVGSMRFHAE